MNLPFKQRDFNLSIGDLDYILSKLIGYAKEPNLGDANKQTLKHHAEDMIAAGQKILKELPLGVEGAPQPE